MPTQGAAAARARLAQPFDEFLRESAILRFKFCYELAWKKLEPPPCRGHRGPDAAARMQESLQAGLIRDGNGWSEIPRYRNRTSHTDDEHLADEVYAFIASRSSPRP